MSTATNQTELEEQFVPTTAAMWQRWLPWLRLLRGFRIAIDARRMLLAMLAISLWSAGDWVLSHQKFSTSTMPVSSVPISMGPVASAPAIWPWESSSMTFASEAPVLPAANDDLRLQDAAQIMTPSATIPSARPWRLTAPMLRVLDPGLQLLTSTRVPPARMPLILTLILGCLISAIFGGAISRMAAVDFARNEEISMRSALRFSLRNWAAFLGAPLIAFAGFGACWLFNFFAGLVAHVPVLGAPLVAFFWCLLILSGFVMALILLGIGLGWPLMIAAISTDAGDAFDGLSRACSYLLNRPWYGLFLACLSLGIGSLLLLFVDGMVEFTAKMTVIPYAASGMVAETTSLAANENQPFPVLQEWTNSSGDPYEYVSEGSATRTLQLFWMRLLASVPAAFVFSYFWTMVTIIYFLLRKREDATPLNEVWVPETTTRTGMPLVGIPAAEMREKNLHSPAPSASPADPASES